MTNLSQRIMDAWLEVNPKPVLYSPEMDEKHRLEQLLALEAYESAVIQFLVPVNEYGERWDYAVFRTNCGLTCHAWCASKDDHFGDSEAEALLNAIISSRQEK